MDVYTFADKQIDWLGHASFRIRGSKTIYIDPWKLDNATRDGDVVMSTHFHYDHYNADDIKKCLAPGGTLLLPVADGGREFPDAHRLAAGEFFKEDGIVVQAIPSYNTNKKFHPQEHGGLGYIVEVDGIRIYHAGDTDVIGEMKMVTCDIVLLPVSGTYVMTADEAVEALRLINPVTAIPMHWGDIVGEEEDARKFAASAPCKVIIKDNPR